MASGVPAWGIEDRNCQLCHKEVGTLEHRWHCEATSPPDGWPAAPEVASVVAERIEADRRRLLKTRGLLALRLPKPPADRAEWFTWQLEPPDDTGPCTWYIDGSMLDGDWVDYRAVGFGVVVVSAARELLAYGHGCPPQWCGTAAAAEAWALYVAICLCPAPPQVKTNCYALLRTAEGGSATALETNRPLARVWAAISTALDGDIIALVNRLLTWMPAHQSVAAISNRTLSNGIEMSVVDWRANGLADGLAKQAATSRQAPMAITRLLASGRAATRHAAALLGWVTHSANNLVVTSTLPDGSTVKKVCRDAQQLQYTRKRPRRDPHDVGRPPSAPAPLPCVPVLELCPAAERAPRCCGKEARRERASELQAEQEWHTRRRLAEIAASSRPAAGKRSGAERLEDLRRRVRARLAST